MQSSRGKCEEQEEDEGGADVDSYLLLVFSLCAEREESFLFVLLKHRLAKMETNSRNRCDLSFFPSGLGASQVGQKKKKTIPTLSGPLAHKGGSERRRKGVFVLK